MEANDHAFQSTPHSCDSPMNGHYNQCDRVGCSQNTRNIVGSYGPGGEYRIDTTHPFEVRTEFLKDDGMLTGMRTILVQRGRRVVLSHLTCDVAYLAKLTDALSDGMSLRITYWGQSASTMAWLDAPPCHREACMGSHAGEAIISNITVSDLEDVPPVSDHRSDDGAQDGSLDASAGKDSEKHRWVSDPWAPWKCHHYVGNQQETRWCGRVGFEGGFEYKYTGGEGALCGPCWCCKRKAKLAGSGVHATQAPSWSTPAPTWNTPAPAWSPPTTTQAVATKAPSLMKGEIKIGGVESAYLAGTGGNVDGDTMTIHHNAGFTIFTDKEKTWEPENIEEFKLLGKIISYRVDLSKVGCACNLAFYLISMPARDMQGKPSPGTNRQGQPPYYCDANMVGGQWCPEIDIMEANNHAFQATLHRCDPAVNQHYSFCDRGGCEQTTRTKENAYGPGSEYTIDTTRPFDVDTEFLKNDGVLSGMRTTLRQDGRQEIMEHSNCNKAYLAKLNDAMAAGMSLRITYWGGEAQTMAWMDVPPCGGAACQGSNAGDAVVSNIQIKASSSVDRELVWVVWDPEDELFGTVVPHHVVADHHNFAKLNKEAIAKWEGARHFLRQMPRAVVKAQVKKVREAESRGVASDLITADCDDPESPCDVSVHKESSYFNSFLKKYSPLSVALPSVSWWPMHLAFFVAMALLAGAGASLLMRRLVKPRLGSAAATTSKKEPGFQAVFARASPSRAGSVDGASPMTPTATSLSTSMVAFQGEGPSPLRRPRAANLLASPPKGPGRQELLSLLEASAE
eukprot:CAMPEP_0115607112 /NCGR_PEP_ID=MMETSP0272-20121206/18342_1 /TAXON_ID=71861 /ORGANISM="Scrippsiella trochoidea, Strain CCMP3099" /LENGTH=793 /DNA_ID=CAMNT_0003042789 /DNA_START=1 /DNA_END=2382 /DNA_ORIENTATION=+